MNPWDRRGLWDLQSRAVPCALGALSPVKGTITEMTHSYNGSFLLSRYTESTPAAYSTVSATKAVCNTSLFFSPPPILGFFYSVFRWCGVSSVTQQAPSRPSGSISPETSSKPRCSSGFEQHAPTRQSVQNRRNFSQKAIGVYKPALLRLRAGSHVLA